MNKIYTAHEVHLIIQEAKQEEREACAEVCDAYGMPDGTSETARILAATIRARWQYD